MDVGFCPDPESDFTGPATCSAKVVWAAAGSADTAAAWLDTFIGSWWPDQPLASLRIKILPDDVKICHLLAHHPVKGAGAGEK